jgi:hypothetical protein
MDNSRKGRKNKIKPGYGIADYYNYYTKEYSSLQKYNIDKSLYRKIVKDFNTLIINEIVVNNYEFNLPNKLGKIFLRKFKPTLKIQNNVLVNHNPPDFKKTRELWDKDPEAKEKKILVRHLNKHTKGFIFVVKYSTGKANYKNKSVYDFSIIREVKQLINKATRDYDIDTFLL